ncbi:MAG TPA: acyl-ACP--UDP-N-acetylglucosamine O-acyltransferase [Casimicrobiaceae bacterium]|nr:acyl-ACP--UDP-N-acetylglucosamine O-acyltransferase [Casimicrobiaceae bacterium]
MAELHPTAIVDATAELAEDVKVGPYSIIGARVRIGRGSVIGPHVVVGPNTTLGARNRVFQFASIGEAPQDRKYAGEPTTAVIGDDNLFREYVSIHSGTPYDRGETTIGNQNLFLAYSHVAHDCIVGNHTTWSNNAQIAGHVVIDDWVVLGAFCGIHQYCRVGAHAMLGAFSVVLQDVPPFLIVQGYPAQPKGINGEGLKRRNFSSDDILAVRRAYKTLYRKGLTLDDATAALKRAAEDSPVVAPFVDFLASSRRGILR